MILTKFNLHYLNWLKLQRFKANCVLEDDFKRCSLYIHMLTFDSPIAVLPYPRRSGFEQTWIFPTCGCFHKSNSFSGQLIFEKIFLYLFHNIYCIAHGNIDVHVSKKQLILNINLHFTILWLQVHVYLILSFKKISKIIIT